jgi:lipoprotein-releasing system ATP-binding protein
MTLPLFKAHLLSYHFALPEKQALLTDLSLSLFEGTSTAVLGKSGAGKTTLLHLLGGLLIPSSGHCSFHGNLIQPKEYARFRSQHLGYIFQSYLLLQECTALENVLMPSYILKRPSSPKRGLELLDMVGLRLKAYQLAKSLSGGEKQRVCLARALCNDPSLLFADEPTGSLDPTQAALVEDLLFSLVKRGNKSLLLVTHDMELARRCDRRLVLEQGELRPSH